MALRRYLPLVIPASSGKHTASLIFAHGFGATSSDWALLAELPRLQHVKFIFPQAPMRPITIARGETMPAWFDIINPSHGAREKDGDEDEDGMEESLATLEGLVEDEVRGGIPRERVVVGGFSQGAALALFLATKSKGSKLGGVIVLSGYMPLQWKLLKMKSAITDETPIFWAHGTSDNVIPYQTGKEAFERMRDSGASKIDFHTYQGLPHGYCEEELSDLEAWLLQRIPPSPPSPKL